MRDFGEDRALLLEFGVDPRAIGEMCLAELHSTFVALKRRQNKSNDRPMSDGEFDELLANVQKMNLPGVNLH